MLEKIKQEFQQGKILLQFSFVQAFGQGFGMIAPLVIAKFFTEDLFGSYVLARMIVFFLLSILITSAQVPFVVFANQERAVSGKINKSFSVQCTFLVFSIAAFLFFSFLFSGHIKSFAEVSTADLVFMSLGFIGIAAKSFFCNLFMALGRRIKSAFVELVFGGVTLALILALAMTDKINLKAAFLVYFISGAAVVLIFIKMIDFGQLLPFEFGWGHFKKMFDFTKWIMFGATAIYFINWVDNIILRMFKASMADIGEYGLGYLIFKAVVMMIYVLSSYFLPFITEHIEDREKIRDYLSRKRPKILLLGFVAIGLLFVAGPYVFRFVYEDAYQSSVDVMRILLIGSLVIMYTTFYIPIINALKEYKFSQGVNVIQIIIKVVLSVILIPKFGLRGAATATVVSYVCKAVFYELYFWMRLRKSLKL
jgi:O-antigen/teichoic acid export membrane protein